MTSRSLHRCVSSSLIALGLVACTLDERATGMIPLPPAERAEEPVQVELDAAAEADASAAEPVLDASEPAAVDTPALPPAVRMQPPAEAEDAGAPQPPPPPSPPPPP